MIEEEGASVLTLERLRAHTRPFQPPKHRSAEFQRRHYCHIEIR